MTATWRPDADMLADYAAEQAIARDVEAAWPGTIVGSFPLVTVLDWWLAKRHVMVGVAEVKRRHVTATTYGTVYLSVSKYLALTLAGMTFGVAPLFIVGFDDGAWWLDLRTIAPDGARLAGRRDRGRAHDVEPLIELPMGRMRPLSDRIEWP